MTTDAMKGRNMTRWRDPAKDPRQEAKSNLITPEGHARLSGILDQLSRVRRPEISAKVLEKTVQYFYYKLKHSNHSGPLPEFKIEPEQALELLMAANFLDT